MLVRYDPSATFLPAGRSSCPSASRIRTFSPSSILVVPSTSNPASSLDKYNIVASCVPSPWITHGASGTNLNVIGEVILAVSLPDTYKHPFVVIDVPVILATS